MGINEKNPSDDGMRTCRSRIMHSDQFCAFTPAWNLIGVLLRKSQ